MPGMELETEMEGGTGAGVELGQKGYQRAMLDHNYGIGRVNK